MNDRAKRSSNIELLRIVAMLFIIAHHLLVHGLDIWQSASWVDLGTLSLDAAFFVGVNVFLLISGYCGIRFSWIKALRIYLLCAFVGMLGYFLHLHLDDACFGRSFLFNSVFAISHAPWFIKSYMFLFFLSPFLNAALQSMTKEKLLFTLATLSVLCVYFGWYWQDEINPSGYGLINFIWIYILGRCIHLYIPVDKFKVFHLLLLWIIPAICNAAMVIWNPELPIWTYNNPLVVLSAISFFLLFLKLKFQSRTVNIIASSSLGIYLIHENNYISSLLYGFDSVIGHSVFVIISLVISIFVLCGIVDIMIRYLLVDPIISHLENYTKKIKI